MGMAIRNMVFYEEDAEIFCPDTNIKILFWDVFLIGSEAFLIVEAELSTPECGKGFVVFCGGVIMFKGIFTRSFHTFSTDLRGYMSLSFIHFHRLFISLYRFTFFSTPSPLTVTPYFLVSPLLVYLQSFLFYLFLFSSNNFFFFSNLILLLFFDYSFVFRTKTDHFFLKLIIKHFLRVVLVDCIAKRNCSVFLYFFSNILRPKHFF